MSEHPLRVGLVGANAERSWAKVAHVPALDTLPGVQSDGCRHATTGKRRSGRAGVRRREAYDDFRRLVRSDNVDIVTVCVRVPSHLDVVMAALEAGKHVMCEWPLGRDIEEAEKMAEAARRFRRANLCRSPGPHGARRSPGARDAKHRCHRAATDGVGLCAEHRLWPTSPRRTLPIS